jgi:hypothetical protein
MGGETEGRSETHRRLKANQEETHYERCWPESDSGRSKKKVGVDTGGQSGFAICETEGRSEVATEDWTQVQEDRQGSVAGNSPAAP